MKLSMMLSLRMALLFPNLMMWSSLSMSLVLFCLGQFCPALAKDFKIMKKGEKVLLLMKPQLAYIVGRPLEDDDSRTIFVSNDNPYRHFNKFGEVRKVIIVTDAATGQLTGSAYVEFMRKQAEAISNVGSIPSPGPKGSNVGNIPSSGPKESNMVAPSSSGVYKDEFNTFVAQLNIAVVWFHVHDYAKALSASEPLYQNIDLVEETTKLHICLLLLDVVLACGDVSKSAVILSYLEKAFGAVCASQNDNLSPTQQQSANMVSKPSSISSSSPNTNA